MKGRISLKDETKLAFELVSINTKNQIMTIKEVLWNANMNSQKFEWGQSNIINL
jgi:hypothetical protein